MDLMRLDKVSFSYEKEKPVLKELSLILEKGQCHVILGENGAGKSTLFFHLNGLLKPDSGEIFYCGEPLKYNNSSLSALRSRVVLLFQNPDDQILGATVEEDVSFGPLNLGLSPAETNKRIDRILDKMGLTDLRFQPTAYLSGGEKQKVALAGILVMEPELLIFDEPMSSLDPLHASVVEEILKDLKAEGKTLLLATHDVNLALRLADKIFILNQGMLIKEGSPEEVLIDESLLRQANLVLPDLVKTASLLQKAGLIAAGSIPRSHQELAEMLNAFS